MGILGILYFALFGLLVFGIGYGISRAKENSTNSKMTYEKKQLYREYIKKINTGQDAFAQTEEEKTEDKRAEVLARRISERLDTANADVQRISEDKMQKAAKITSNPPFFSKCPNCNSTSLTVTLSNNASPSYMVCAHCDSKFYT